MERKEVLVFIISMAIMLMLMGCAADVPSDTTNTAGVISTADATNATTELATVPTVETKAPTQPITTPTKPEENEPRQAGLRLNEEQLAYFEKMFRVTGQLGEDYYNLILNLEFASIQDIYLTAFFEDGSPEDMKNEITQSEYDYYVQVTGDAWHISKIDRLSYAMVSDVFLSYLGVTIPQMNMDTLVYNPYTGYYYRAGSGTFRHHNPDFTDGYYDEETGLVSLYFVGGYIEIERIVTLRYKPEQENVHFWIVSNLPAA